MQRAWAQTKTEKMFDLMFDTMICYYLLKNSLKGLILEKIADNITLHAKKLSLKCALERCETAIKTYDPLYKHLKLGVSPNLLKVLD